MVAYLLDYQFPSNWIMSACLRRGWRRKIPNLHRKFCGETGSTLLCATLHTEDTVLSQANLTVTLYFFYYLFFKSGLIMDSASNCPIVLSFIKSQLKDLTIMNMSLTCHKALIKKKKTFYLFINSISQSHNVNFFTHSFLYPHISK